MNRSTLCFSVFLLFTQLSTVSNAADTGATDDSPTQKNALVFTLEDSATADSLTPLLKERRLERDQSDYLEEPHRFSTFRDFERDRYRERLRKSYIGMGVGLSLAALGTTAAIVGTIIIFWDLNGCNDVSGSDYSDCAEEQGLVAEIAAFSFYPAAALFIIPGVVIASIYGIRANRTKKVLDQIGWSSSDAISLKSFGAFPVPGGAAFGASFAF